MARNKCKEAGCAGSCCQFTSLGMPKDVFDRWSQGAKEIHRTSEDGVRASSLLAGEKTRQDGELVVAILEGEDHGKDFDWAIVQLLGLCHHFDSAIGGCDDYENRPPACDTFKIDSKRCRYMRKKFG